MCALAQQIYQELSDAVVEMDEELAAQLSQQAVEHNIDAYTAIDQGLAHGMQRAGDLFEAEEYFIPELLLCSDAMYSGLEILRPHIRQRDAARKYKVVIGVIEGDTHDIGKNLVKIMLEAAGFEVIDLGRDIAPASFVEAAVTHEADVIALSTLMTTTMDGMAKVINLLEEQGLRQRFKVIVGGGPISQSFADKIGANGYSHNAVEAVRLTETLCTERVN